MSYFDEAMVDQSYLADYAARHPQSPAREAQTYNEPPYLYTQQGSRDISMNPPPPKPALESGLPHPLFGDARLGNHRSVFAQQNALRHNPSPPPIMPSPRKSNLMSLLNDAQVEEPSHTETKRVLPQVKSWCPVDDCPRSMKIGRSPFVDNAMMMVHLHTMHPDKTEGHQNSPAQYHTSESRAPLEPSTGVQPPRDPLQKIRDLLDKKAREQGREAPDESHYGKGSHPQISSMQAVQPKYNGPLKGPPESADLFLSDPGAGTQEQEATGLVQTQTKKRLRASCDACSRAKVKCDKKRPTCSKCGTMGICCNYSVSMRTGHAKALPSASKAVPTWRRHSLDSLDTFSSGPLKDEEHFPSTTEEEVGMKWPQVYDSGEIELPATSFEDPMMPNQFQYDFQLEPEETQRQVNEVGNLTQGQGSRRNSDPEMASLYPEQNSTARMTETVPMAPSGPISSVLEGSAIAQSPGSATMESFFSPAVNNAVNPTRARKKLNLSDFTSKRAKSRASVLRSLGKDAEPLPLSSRMEGSDSNTEPPLTGAFDGRTHGKEGGEAVQAESMSLGIERNVYLPGVP
jgi:hypothetical protein